MKMDGNTFWACFWAIVVVGCTTDSALSNHFKVKYEETKLEQMKYKFENNIDTEIIQKENK